MHATIHCILSLLASFIVDIVTFLKNGFLARVVGVDTADLLSRLESSTFSPSLLISGMK